ncbi:MAG: lipopolysaccharide heptosyltransferase II [Nitrospirae bacterium]|nr:MAG: lipopolysaccharide heptosyltransferase II [Nitrospirota bacterium]
MANTEKILIRGVNWVGDSVMTLPAIKAVRAAFPQSEITLLARPSVAAVFEKSPFIDLIFEYDDKYRGLGGKLRLAKELRQKKFGKAILLQNAFDAALLSFLSAIPERIGYGRDGRRLLLTDAVPCGKAVRKLHHIDYYLHLLNEIGINASDRSPHIRLGIEERVAARRSFADLGRPLLGINPGAAYGSAKRWLPGRFADVAQRFIAETGGGVVVFGGKAETAIADEIFKKVRGQKLLAAGKNSLRELIAQISECDVLLSNDSGPMHIAYAVGTPLLAIFGSTSPELTGPHGKASIVIKSDADCSPCFERTCKDRDLRCMEGITADMVYEGVRSLVPQRKAVFFDRDGTLCKDAHYLDRWEDFEIFPDVAHLGELKERGYMLIGVSNQSGIARGLVDEAFTKAVNNIFLEKYSFDDFLYCPHGPHDGCGCRKPEPGMVLEARARHRISLKSSYVIGDKDVDMLLAKASGAKGVLVLTGQHKESRHADFIVKDLREAVKVIIEDGAD